MTNDLASKVLLNDVVPYGILALYILPNYQNVAYTYYNGKMSTITQADEIIVPLQDEDVNFDEVLIQMLDSSVEGDLFRNITARYVSKKHFQKIDFTPVQTITHPSFSGALPLSKRCVSEFCPKDTVYFLPAPELLGVYVSRENDAKDAGIGVLYSHRVLKIALGVHYEQ